ncbi:helix-turn-helix transcriptional regulator [Dyadobacter chenwenxiniae]|uniref:Helix-turn-helix transcriptional regulator n=1 Tax=Dyadobacter chenwenxiniae TaxID=2906456 RepID=A0A9X1TIA9_9BACT|nr:helix-turn-helix transcriptional regulator [Dyadobacter chenwenxiniae]UON86361.1 helix-turn-helix transcriptional regulator [Dyadobacter chenwenxiniae]
MNLNTVGLTAREKEIVRLIKVGKTYKVIAEQLFISERTVSKHVQNVFEKLGVSNRVELLNRLDIWESG